MSWPSCILDKLRKAPVVILTIGGSEKLIWTYLFFTNNIYVNTHVWNIWKNLHATCIVIRSSSAPWRPGTSARHRRGIPWSLQFFLLNAVWNKIYICITWMTFEYFLWTNLLLMWGYPIICLVWSLLFEIGPFPNMSWISSSFQVFVEILILN